MAWITYLQQRFGCGDAETLLPALAHLYLRLAKVDTDGLMTGYDRARLPGLGVDAGANVGWITGKIFAQAGDLMRKRFASANPNVSRYLSCKYSPKPQVAVVSIEPTEVNFRQLAAAAAYEMWELEGWVGVQARRSQ